MTYDVYFTDGEKDQPSPFAIHGMAYGAQVFDWARKFVFSDNVLSPEEVKKLAKEFHDLMVGYCKAVSGTNYFGGDPTGCYYLDAINEKRHNPEIFLTTKRWLEVYVAASAFGWGLKFQ